MLTATTSDYAGRLCSHLEMSGTTSFPMGPRPLTLEQDLTQMGGEAVGCLIAERR
jgi:hypothetical protein